MSYVCNTTADTATTSGADGVGLICTKGWVVESVLVQATLDANRASVGLDVLINDGGVFGRRLYRVICDIFARRVFWRSVDILPFAPNGVLGVGCYDGVAAVSAAKCKDENTRHKECTNPTRQV